MLRGQHARHGRLHFIDGVVDDVVVADVHAIALGQLASAGVSPGVKANDDRLGGNGQIDVTLGNTTDRAVDNLHSHLGGGELLQRLHQRFLRALDIGLDDQSQGLSLTFAHVLKHVLQLRSLPTVERDLAVLALAERGDFTRTTLVGQDHEVIARLRHLGQTLQFHRDGRTRGLNGLAILVQHGTHPAITGAGQHHVATRQGAALHQDRGHRTAALVKARLNDDTFGSGLGGRFDFQHLGLEKHLLQQVVYALARLGGHRHEGRVATKIFRHHTFSHQLALQAFDIGLGLVNLVHGHHQGHFGSLGVVNGFFGLRHHTIVGSHDQNDDVCGFGTARPHGGKRFVTRGVQKGDHSAGCVDVIRTDVLRDAASFACSHARAANVVQQRGLAMVHVTHDGDHRCARQLLSRLRCLLLFGKCLRVVQLGREGLVAHFFDHDHGGLLVQLLVDGDHLPQLHQLLDDLTGLDAHLVGQISHTDGLWDVHLLHLHGGRWREGGIRFLTVLAFATARRAPACASPR